MAKCNLAPNGRSSPIPTPAAVVYTDWFTFMKWFESPANRTTASDHAAYARSGRRQDHANMIEYMAKQLKRGSVPKLERARASRSISTDCVNPEKRPRPRRTCDAPQTARNRPSPIDSYFGGIYYIGPIFVPSVARTMRWSTTGFYVQRSMNASPRAAPVTPEGPANKISPGGRGAAELDQLPPALEDV